MWKDKRTTSARAKTATFIIILVLVLSLSSDLYTPVKAVEEEPETNQYAIEQGFSEINTPAFITANGESVAVLHRVWSPKLKNWGTWELAELCPYSRMKLGRDSDSWGYAYSVSEAYFGVRYSKNAASFFEWSNDFPNIEYADYETRAPIVRINMSTPNEPDIRLSWVFFTSEEDDGAVWGVSVTNLAGVPLSDVTLYLNFEALINNKHSDFVWYENESAYVIERPDLDIYVCVSSWTPPVTHFHGLNTRQRIYNDILKNTTGRIHTESCGFEWKLGELSPEESSQMIYVFFALGDSTEDALEKSHVAKQKPPSQHYETTLSFWRDWLGKASLESPDPYLNKMFDLSLMFSLMGIHRPSGSVMACMDGTHWMRWGGEASYSRWEFHPYYLHVWVRDLVFFSMVFDLLGYVEEAKDALLFAKEVQNPSGSFYTNYEVDGSVANTAPDETDQTGLYVYGVYFHYCTINDIDFLEETWDSVQRACGFLMNRQNHQGLIYGQASIHEWPGVSEGYEAWTQTCSYAALESGARIAEILGHLSKASEWREAAERVRLGTLNYLWNSTINSFCQRLFNGKQYIWADIKMLTPSLFYVPIINATDSKMTLTYDFLLQRLNDPNIGGIWRYEKDAGDPVVPEQYNGGYGPWFTYTCWFALNKMASGEVDEAFEWIHWIKNHATAQGLFSEHISTSEWHYLFDNPANATRSYYGIGTFGGWIAYTLASPFIKITDHSGLTLQSSLPSYWDSMNLTFTYKDTLFTVRVKGQGYIDKIIIDDQPVQSLRIPDKYCDGGQHTVLITLTKYGLITPYIEEASLLSIQDSSYSYEEDVLSLKVNSSYLLDQSVEIISANKPVVVYVNGVPAPNSKSLNMLFHDVGWVYNETGLRLYLKIKASVNPIIVSSIFSYSLKVKTVDYNNNVLTDSIVTLYWLNGTKIQVQRSNSDGVAHLNRLQNGVYRIYVDHKGTVYESTVEIEEPVTDFTAKLEIVGFLFGIPITKLVVDLALIAMTVFVIVYIFKKQTINLFKKNDGLKKLGKKMGVKGDVTKWLDKDKQLIFAFFCLAIINLIIVYPRLLSGIPMGEDSNSHIFQVLYLHEGHKEGVMPLWSSYWYCGFPFLLFYPPLSYLSIFSLSLIGMSPVFAYKLVEAFFYVLAPFTVYFLARTINLKKREALLASLAFSLIPGVIANLIFWDRYPTVVATPLLVLLSAFTIRFLKDEKISDLILAGLSWTFLLLIHHLSAYCAVMVVIILCVTYLLMKRDWSAFKRVIKLGVFTGVTSSLISLFWLGPFLNFSPYLAGNPFTNGDVWDSYLPPEHWDLMLYKFEYLGLIQWILATYVTAYFIACWIDKGRHTTRAKLICYIPTVFALSAFFIQPFNIHFHQIELLILLGVSVVTPILLSKAIKRLKWEDKLQFIMPAVWLFIFAWLSFGSHALLFKLVPYWPKLDTYRFSLFAGIPECILVGKLASLYTRSRPHGEDDQKPSTERPISPRTLSFLFVTILLVTNTFVGFSKYNDFNYRYNEEISEDLVNYFNSQDNYARILPIECPRWIYLLPIYTGKPLLDGWYPQAKVLPFLVSIDDYTLNVLVKTHRAGGDIARIDLWRNVISNYSLLGIEWIVLPEDNQTLNTLLMGDNQDFYLDSIVDGFVIYRSSQPQRIVQTDAKLIEASWHPNQITIIIETTESTYLTVKEAYFPEWTIQTNASSWQLTQDEDGFIKIQVTPALNSKICQISLVYERPYQGILYIFSTFAFLSIVIAYYVLTRRKKNWFSTIGQK